MTILNAKVKILKCIDHGQTLGIVGRERCGQISIPKVSSADTRELLG